MSNDKTKTITAQFEEIKYDICNNYCKYPLIYDEEAEDWILPGASAETTAESAGD